MELSWSAVFGFCDSDSLGRVRDEEVVTTEDGTDVIIDDNDDDGDDDMDDDTDDAKLETVVESDGVVVKSVAVDETFVWVNGADTGGMEVTKDGVIDEVVGGGGALEVELEAKALTVTEAMVLVTVATDWEALTPALGSVTFTVLSVLIVAGKELALVAPKDMPELPGVVPELSSPNWPLSWSSPVALEVLPLLPGVTSLIFPSRLVVGFTPGGRPVLFLDFGSRESTEPEALSSSEVPASNGTGRYGGIVFTWLPFLCWEL